MSKVILISQFPLPFSGIGSWTTLYGNYFESGHRQIDHIICPEPKNRFDGIQYGIVKSGIFSKINEKLQYFRVGFVDKLESMISEDEKCVIQIVDSFHLAGHVHRMLQKKGIRHNCHIQFFYHGFAPFWRSELTPDFYREIDEIVLLTHDSYKVHLNHYVNFPFRVSVLYNGVDVDRFRPVSTEKKSELKSEFGVSGKKVFLWCSNNRPKKGLQVVLEAWKNIHRDHKDAVLLVVGAEKSDPEAGVRYFGRIPNKELAKYYQVADCYLFPTLCQEGFGMSLVEALNCGCHCIASHQGGVPEVLQYGKLGKLIDRPNFASEWEKAMNDYLTGREPAIILEKPMYLMQDWNEGMDRIVLAAKQRFS